MLVQKNAVPTASRRRRREPSTRQRSPSGVLTKPALSKSVLYQCRRHLPPPLLPPTLALFPAPMILPTNTTITINIISSTHQLMMQRSHKCPMSTPNVATPSIIMIPTVLISMNRMNLILDLNTANLRVEAIVTISLTLTTGLIIARNTTTITISTAISTPTTVVMVEMQVLIRTETQNPMRQVVGIRTIAINTMPLLHPITNILGHRRKVVVSTRILMTLVRVVSFPLGCYEVSDTFT